MSNPSAVAWSTVAARGNKTKVVNTLQSRFSPSGPTGLVPATLFEDEGLKQALLVKKATAILQQSLISRSVLFSFPAKLFSDRIEAYKLIETQISGDVEFLPISMYSNRADSELLISAKFDNKVDRDVALVSGVTHNGVVYHAVASNSADGMDKGLTHVHFSLLHSVSREPEFLVKLIRSLEYYGRMYQVKKYTRKGYFEGKMSVVLDTSVGYTNNDGEEVSAQLLSRNLYLEAWDCFAVATFKNAPPVCHFCRLSGLMRASCPQLAKRRCFGCGQHGCDN